MSLCLFSCEDDNNKTGASLELSTKKLDLFDNAQDTVINITSSGTWNIIATCECDWLSVDPMSGGSGLTPVTVSLSANDDKDDGRVGFFVVASGQTVDTVHVYQTPNMITVSANTLIFDDQIIPVTKEITVKSTLKWTVETTAEWLSIWPRSSASASVKMTVTAQPNVSEGERTAQVIITTDLRNEIITVTQKKTSRFIISTDSLELPDKGYDAAKKAYYRYIRITSSNSWTASISADWLDMEKTGGEQGSGLIKVYAKTNNNGGADREADITITSGEQSEKIHVKQGFTGDYWNDNDVKIVRKHTRGAGVPVVIVGDGFDRQDLRKGGWWEMWATRLAVNHFLDVEMFRDPEIQDYLDVYILFSESQERGINYAPYTKTKTKFNASVSEDWSGAINAAIAAVNRNRAEANNAQEATWDNISVMFMANSAYPGNASDPLSRMGVDEQSYDYWALHEFGGHILGNVPDLYGNDGSSKGNAVTQSTKDNMDKAHDNGLEWYVDYHTDAASVVWKEFIGATGYTDMPTGAPYYNESNNIGVYSTGWQANNWQNKLKGPSFKTGMREWYLCFDVGTRFHIWNTVRRIAGEYGTPKDGSPFKPNNQQQELSNFNLAAALAEFKEYDLRRSQCDCRWGKYKGMGGNDDGTPYLWTKYNAQGKKTRNGAYDRFWRALWPVTNSDK
jgi:hypothetical protein